MEARAKIFLNRAVGSLVAGLLTGTAIFGAILYDDIESSWEYPDRKAFYDWALQYAVLPGLVTSAISYAVLPAALRRLARQDSLAKQLGVVIEEKAQKSGSTEEISQLIRLQRIMEDMEL